MNSWLQSSKPASGSPAAPDSVTASTNTMSITRALVELKTLDKRIQKLISESVFISIKGELRKPDTRASSAQSNYDRVRDLMNRRIKLKSAIVSSNANTKIRVCSMDMTVAEAIEMKSSINNYKTLLSSMKRQYGDAVTSVEVENQRARSTLENSLTRTRTTSVDQTNNNGSEINVGEYSRQYMSIHGVELFDPIKLSEKVESLEKFITEFESEVDFVLSEKNATTQISI
jgi:hypothetical protein